MNIFFVALDEGNRIKAFEAKSVARTFKKTLEITDFRIFGYLTLQMHIHLSEREHSGGLKTLLFYLLGSWHL